MKPEVIAELQAAVDRAVTIADEAFGIGPVEPPDDTLTRIERGISEQHQRIQMLERTLGQALTLLEATSDRAARLEWARKIREYIEAWRPA